VFRERIVTCFIDDPTGVAVLDRVGVDQVCWEADYPHSDSTWPTSPEMLGKSLDAAGAAAPNAEVLAKITHRNAMRHFRYDPFALRPREQCTVGALRASAADVDVTPRSHGVRPATAGPKATNATFLTQGRPARP
jgi:hypothetical protein